MLISNIMEIKWSRSL